MTKIIESASRPAFPQRAGRTGAWRVLQWFVGAGLLAYILSKVNWREFVEVARDADLLWLVAVVALSVADRLWMAGKWHYLLRAFRVDVHFLETAYVYHVGVLTGIAVQWQLSGDVMRAVHLGQTTGQRREVVATVVFEKISGLTTNVIVAAWGLALLTTRIEIEPAALAVVMAVAATALLLGAPQLLFSRRAVDTLVRIRPSLFEGLADLQAAPERARLAQAAWRFQLLTLLEQGMPILAIGAAIHALGFEVTLIETAAVVPIIMLISRLPISIDGLGVYEGLSVALFTLVGLTVTEAFALAIATRVLGLASVALAVPPLMKLAGRVRRQR